MNEKLNRIYNAARKKQEADEKAKSAEQTSGNRPGGLARTTREQVAPVLAKLKELIEEADPAFITIVEQRGPVILTPDGAPRPIGIAALDGKLLPYYDRHHVLFSSIGLTPEDAARKLAEIGIDAAELEEIWIRQANELVNRK